MNIKEDDIFDINLSKIQMFDLLNKVTDDNIKIKKENELLKEEIKELKSSIESAYYTLVALETIGKKEINRLENEDIEEI